MGDGGLSSWLVCVKLCVDNYHYNENETRGGRAPFFAGFFFFLFLSSSTGRGAGREGRGKKRARTPRTTRLFPPGEHVVVVVVQRRARNAKKTRKTGGAGGANAKTFCEWLSQAPSSSSSNDACVRSLSSTARSNSSLSRAASAYLPSASAASTAAAKRRAPSRVTQRASAA